jgi:ribosome-binding factor A
LDPHRHDRVSEGIREELEEMMNYELEDPRVGPSTITSVIVSPDYRRAAILISAKGTPDEQVATLEAIKGAKHFLKQQLTERLQLFKTPELYFDADISPQLAAKAPKLLRRMRRTRSKDA